MSDMSDEKAWPVSAEEIAVVLLANQTHGIPSIAEVLATLVAERWEAEREVLRKLAKAAQGLHERYCGSDCDCGYVEVARDVHFLLSTQGSEPE